MSNCDEYATQLGYLIKQVLNDETKTDEDVNDFLQNMVCYLARVHLTYTFSGREDLTKKFNEKLKPQ